MIKVLLNDPKDAGLTEYECTRWRCEYCNRSYAKKSYARAHVRECYRNPSNEGCGSCIHFTRRLGEDEGGNECDVDAFPSDRDFVRGQCNQWKGK